MAIYGGQTHFHNKIQIIVIDGKGLAHIGQYGVHFYLGAVKILVFKRNCRN
jgi:deoxyinosine 3'endonuclease (endonuclease V)